MTGCSQPGCPGTIVDGYCDVCGSPGPVDPSAEAPRADGQQVATPDLSGSALHAAGLFRHYRRRLLRCLRHTGRASRVPTIRRRYRLAALSRGSLAAPHDCSRPPWAHSGLPEMVPRSPNGFARGPNGSGLLDSALGSLVFRRRP